MMIERRNDGEAGLGKPSHSVGESGPEGGEHQPDDRPDPVYRARSWREVELPPVSDERFSQDMWKIFNDAGELLLRKHHDYGPHNIGASPGGPLNGLRVRMWDKMARINNLLDKGVTPENESLRDSFLDLLNYSAITLMVIDGKWPSK